jgi:hypothetical protein
MGSASSTFADLERGAGLANTGKPILETTRSSIDLLLPAPGKTRSGTKHRGGHLTISATSPPSKSFIAATIHRRYRPVDTRVVTVAIEPATS